MLRNLKKILVGAALVATVPWVYGFSLLGPGGGQGVAAKLWQLPAQNDGWDIGYNLGTDIGAPVNFGEFYRWNTPVITYAFDSSFVTYFGSEGMKAVDAAMRILNELPHTSKMSQDLSEFPLNSAHQHAEAAQLGLVDLKSAALSIVLEQLGLADPIRWNYAIRQRINLANDFGDYSITRFNFDPVTIAPSSYVNGTLWTYRIFESIPTQTSDAVEELPPALANEPVNYPVAAISSSPLAAGYYFTGLTRDDVGGLRYLLRPRNIVAETLLPDVTANGGGPFSPYLGTNTLTNAIGGATGTNGSAGLRGGLGKLKFRKVIAYQAPFKSVTLRYRDQFITTNGLHLKQGVVRTLVAPDITFTADDIFPNDFFRTDTTSWINNEGLNGLSPRGGPGVIAPPIVISFNNLPRVLRNQTPFFVTEPFITDGNARTNGLFGILYASFDGTTNDPVIYPVTFGYSVQTLRNLAGGNQP